jgi:UDP-glucose 4-epimerase
VRKAPACTLETLTVALADLFQRPHKVDVIGTRHGEKLYETLVAREELSRAADLGDYYRIPVDDRDLNYELYFSEGEDVPEALEDYTSHNTSRLDVTQTQELLMALPHIRSALLDAGVSAVTSTERALQ